MEKPKNTDVRNPSRYDEMPSERSSQHDDDARDAIYQNETFCVFFATLQRRRPGYSGYP